MTEIIITWVLSLLTFILGFAIGRNANIIEALQEAKKGLKEIIKSSKVGAIKRPSAREIYEKNTFIKETKEEVKKALDSFPELKQAREEKERMEKYG